MSQPHVDSQSLHCLSFEDIASEAVGGKAWGLAQLRRMGLNVPPGFVICNARAGEYPEDLDTRCNALGAEPLAVRSSAQGEDGADTSFAGQYETVLNVCGEQAVRDAIDVCVQSTASARAKAYIAERDEATETAEDAASVVMNIVVQRMVDARTAGVLFTADPHSARRDLLVIDAVAGLGEALVSGEATPDHYAITNQGNIQTRELVGAQALLSDAEINTLAQEARRAAEVAGQPLDMEWAINQQGELFWLQARPITTLPADLNELDTTLPRPDDILTISNVSEMMPGAVSPLTASFTGWGIDYGLQHMQVSVGARAAIEPDWQITAAAYGHLFLNLTGNVLMGAAVLGSSAQRTAQTLCGRPVPELRDPPPQSTWRRILNTVKLLKYGLQAPGVVDRFSAELAHFHIPLRDDSAAMLAAITERTDFFNRTMAVHIQSSALSGILSSTVENMVSSESDDSTEQEQAEAVRLLSGATGVESAEMLQQLDALINLIAAHTDADAKFARAETHAALTWLRETPDICTAFTEFLTAHGHRGYRELCIRDASWGDEPQQLVQSMQAGVVARLTSGATSHPVETNIDWRSLNRGLRWVLPKAHNAIRRRERTKSQLVLVAHKFKLALRHLGKLLVDEGKLPDADLLYFFTVEELPAVVATPSPRLLSQALARRAALPFQQLLEFPEISVGIPEPLSLQAEAPDDGILRGRPASRGIVEGIARVATTLEEAASLQPNEILVTPITDIGWTPYFSMIAGLVTDLGSAVSHGAVIAREYGLPCVVNTRNGTRLIETGDRIVLDGDSGRVTWVNKNPVA